MDENENLLENEDDSQENISQESEIVNEDNNEDSQVNSQISELEEKIKNLEHDLALSRADFYNYRQRVNKERLELRKHAQEDLITSILPVLDNLDRALDAANSEDTKSIITGVDMVRRQFLSILENFGVSIIKTIGEDFKPELHDAAATQNVEDPEQNGKIINELLKGYKTKNKILRPAKVIVGKLENN